MLLLASTSDVLRVVTSDAVTVQVHASYVDLNGTTVTPGRKNTSITTATTTSAVLAPGASTVRNVKFLSIKNVDPSSALIVTIQHFDGSTSVNLEEATLAPGATLTYTEDSGFAYKSNGVQGVDPWTGILAGAMNRGDPGLLMRQVQCGGNVAATPTNITTSVARCSMFNIPYDLTVNRIRFYGVGATTTVFRVAIYRLSDLARLTAELPFATVANTWGSAGSALALTLTKDTDYFVAVSVNATGTVAGPTCAGGSVAATTGQVATAPSALPGSLAADAGLTGYFFQFAVTTGALPATTPALAAQAAWTGGMPAFWLDNADV